MPLPLWGKGQRAKQLEGLWAYIADVLGVPQYMPEGAPKGQRSTSLSYALPEGASAYCTFRCWKADKKVGIDSRSPQRGPSGVTDWRPFNSEGPLAIYAPSGATDCEPSLFSYPLGPKGDGAHTGRLYIPKGPGANTARALWPLSITLRARVSWQSQDTTWDAFPAPKGAVCALRIRQRSLKGPEGVPLYLSF